MALGDDFDDAIDHFDGSLIVDRIRRYWYPGGPFFCVGHGVVRHIRVIQVRKQRKVNQSQHSVAAALRQCRVVVDSDGGVTTILPPLSPT
jgi:hypothetical protein